MSKSTCAAFFGTIYLATLLSTVSGQMGSKAWQEAWPPFGQSVSPKFLPAWQADFASIDFSGNGTAPIVPKGQPGVAKGQGSYCDWSFNGCNATTDIYQCTGPMQWGLTFDDGPLPPQSDTLYDFLAKNNQSATHFMIGSNMVQHPDLVKKAFSQGGQIAVHTWTHPYMTTLSNTDAYAELRWTREIIKNITGMTPLFWRPPYGDVDNRIRNIATHLGLITTTWNKDTKDWCIGDAGDGECKNFTPDSIHTNLGLWSAGQKTASHGVVSLEHELSVGSVNQFIQAYPVMKSNGWNIQPVASCNNEQPYLGQSTTTSSAAVSVSSTSATVVSTANVASSASSLTAGALSMVVVVVAALSALQF